MCARARVCICNHLQLGKWLEATLTSLEGARHILEAYFKLGLDDRTDDFLMTNVQTIRHGLFLAMVVVVVVE